MRFPLTAMAPSHRIRLSGSNVRMIPPDTSRSQFVGGDEFVTWASSYGVARSPTAAARLHGDVQTKERRTFDSSKRGHDFGGEALNCAHLLGSDEEQLEVVDAQV